MEGKLIRLSDESQVPEDLTDKIFISTGCDGRFHYTKNVTPITIKYVAAGSETYSINCQRPINVCSGNFLIVNEGHQVECTRPNHPTDSLSIFFSNQLVQNVTGRHKNPLIDEQTGKEYGLAEISQQLWSASSNPLGKTLNSVFNKIYKHVELTDLEFDEYLTGIAEELVLLSLEENILINRTPAIRESTRKEIYKRVHNAREFMLGNLTKTLSLSEISSEANLSKYHFLRSFKAIYGISPYKYLQNARLAKAHELLKLNQHSVSDVARLLRFYDLSYFSNEFKSNFGVRPSQLLK